MQLAPLIASAIKQQASDLHLEPGQPACLRVRGQLRLQGEAVAARDAMAMARELIGEERWPELLERRSCDLAKTLSGARCRINVLCTSRGIGMAIRFLNSVNASLTALNLHPELAKLTQPTHGLVIVSGATGSGKSSTLAALIQEINAREKRHIVTLESPIEYTLAPKQSFIRQREMGRDTPSFEQGLYDSMREDPDVLMVGELRDPETMRLTLNAAETGHLVLTTLHSSSAAEALSRVVAAFPAEIQAGVCAQLADCLVVVICQRMRFFPERNLRVPECEVLVATQSARAVIRSGQFSKLQTSLETGGADGSFTFQRYREWLEKRTDWYTPPHESVRELAQEPHPPEPLPMISPRKIRAKNAPTAEAATAAPARDDGVLEIQADDDLQSILSELEER